MEAAIRDTIDGAIGQGAGFTSSGVLDFSDVNNGVIGFTDPNNHTKLYKIHRILKTNGGYFAETEVGDFQISV